MESDFSSKEEISIGLKSFTDFFFLIEVLGESQGLSRVIYWKEAKSWGPEKKYKLEMLLLDHVHHSVEEGFFTL